jgi:fibronectin-binding autotransporter adhesin
MMILTVLMRRSKRRVTNRSAPWRLAAVFVAMLNASQVAQAQNTTYVWNSGATDVWSNALNWSVPPPVLGGATVTLQFNDGNYTSTYDTLFGTGGFTLNQLNFSNISVSNTVTLAANSGNSLILDGASPQISLTGAGNALIAAPITLNMGVNISNTGTGTLTINGAISAGSNSLTFAGSGAINTGVITFAGAASITNTNTGTTALGAITLGGPTTVTNSSATPLLLSSITGTNQNLTITGTGNTTISGAIATGTGTLTMNGAGKLTISSASGANTFSGIVAIDAGNLSISLANQLGANATATALTLNGGTLQTTGSSAVTFAAAQGTTVGANSAISAGSAAPLTLQALSIGAFTLTSSGAGNVAVNGTTTLTGSPTFSNSGAGTLALGAVTNGGFTVNFAGGGTIATGTVSATASGSTLTLDAGAGALTVAAISRTSGATLTLNNNSTNLFTVTGSITGGAVASTTFGGTGSGGITISGALTPTTGAVTNNMTTGSLTIGTLQGTTANFTNAAGSGPVFITTNITGTTNTITNNSTVGPIAITTETRAGSGALTAAAGATLSAATFNTGATFTTTLSGAGIISLGSAGGINTANGASAISSTNTGTVTLNAITLAGGASAGLTITNNAASGSFAITGTSVANVAATLALTGSGTINVTGNLNNGAAVMTLAYTGSGLAILSGSNSCTGGSTASGSAGVLEFNSSASMGAGGSITATNPSTVALNFANVSQTNLNLFAASSTGTIALAQNSSNNLSFSNLPTAALGAVGSATLSGALTPNGTTYQLGGGGGTLTITSALTDNGGATGIIIGSKGSAAGTVVLSGANTFTGKVTISSGTLSVASLNSVSGGLASSNLGAPTTVANGTISIGSGANGGTLSYTGPTASTDRVIDLSGTTGGATLDLDNDAAGGTLTFTSNLTASGTSGAKTLTLQANNPSGASGVISGVIGDATGGTVAVAKNGQYGSWTLSGANTYSGGTTVSGGELIAANAQAFGVTTGGALTLASSAFAPNFVFQVSPVAYRVTVTGTSSGTITADALTPTSTVSYTLGILTMASAATLNISAGPNVTSAANLAFGSTYVSASATINIGANCAVTLGQLIIGANTLTISGPGSLSVGGGAFLSGNATFNVTGTGVLHTGLASGSGTNLTKTGSGTMVMGSLEIGAGSVVVSGGTLTINGSASSYSGVTTLTAGAGVTLNINNFTAIGSGPLQINDNTIDNTSGSAVSNGNSNTITLGTAGAGFTFGGTNDLNLGTGNVVLTANRTITCNGAADLTIGGTVSGAFALSKAGTGALTLTGNNSNSAGTFTLSGGTLNINRASALGTTAVVFTIAGGTIDNTSNVPITTNSWAQNWNGDFAFGGTNPLNLGVGAVTLGGNRQITMNGASALTIGGAVGGAGYNLAVAGTGSLILNGAISTGTGSVSLTGGGALTLSGNNTFSGGLYIQSGTVTATASENALGGSGAGTVTLGSGSSNATLLVGATGLAFANPIVLSSTGALTFGATGSTAISTTESGGVTGSGNLLIKANAIAGSITFATAALNNTGTIQNIGTGSGGVTISSVIGANVSEVDQNSTTSSLTLSGANTFSGTGLKILAGTVTASTSSTALGAGAVTLGSGSNNATLQVGTTGLSFANPLVLNSAGTLIIANTGAAVSTSFSGGVTGTGNLTINSNVANSTITLSTNPVNNSGAITASGASLTGVVTISAPLGANVTSVTATTLATLNLSGDNSNFGGPVIVTPQATLILGSPTALGGNGSATGTGGTLTISSTLDSATPNLVLTTVNPQVWKGGFFFAGTNSLTMGAGAITLATASAPFYIDANGSTLTEPGVIADNNGSSLVKQGAGAVVLSGLNTFTGGTTINGGTLSITSDGATGGSPAPLGIVPTSVAAANITLNGGTLSAASTLTLNPNRGITVVTFGGLGASPGATLTYGGLLTGGTILSITGGGAVVLTADNSGTFTGDSIQITGSTLSISNDDNLGAPPSSAISNGIQFNNGTLIASAGLTLAANRGIALAGPATLISAAAGQTFTVNGGLGDSFQLTIGGAGNVTLNGQIGGILAQTSVAILMNGTGTLTLANSFNQFSGEVQINSGGTVSISANGNLGTTNGTQEIVFNGGTLTATATIGLGANRAFTLIGAGKIIVANSGQALTYNSTGALNGNTLTVDGAGNLTLNGVISGAGGISTASTFTGTISLNAANTFTGQLNINGGVLAGTGSINSSVATIVNGGGAIRGGIPGDPFGANYGTLAVNNNVNLIAAGNTPGTMPALITELARNPSATGNTFVFGGTNTVAGNASLIDLSSSTTATFNLGTSCSPLGGNNLMTINLYDPTSSLQSADGSYKINLAKAFQAPGNQTLGSPTNFYLNGVQLNAGQTIDSGTGTGLSGAGNYSLLSVTGNNSFANSISSWTLGIDPTGQFMQLTVATPEPQHLLLICAGVLGLSLTLGACWPCAVTRRLCGISRA